MNRNRIEEAIGYTFKDGALLERAFTHPSASPSKGGNYQDLEFLGDSVVGFVTAERLFLLYPDAGEGKLTKMRACVVSESPLAGAVERLGVADEMLLGENESKHGVYAHASVMCDLFEAITAAIYLDGGMEEAKAFVLRALEEELAGAWDALRRTDAKSRLNEYAMQKGVSLRYIEEEKRGEQHSPVFRFSVCLGEERMGEGEGRSKREAQQLAASRTLDMLAAGKRKNKL